MGKNVYNAPVECNNGGKGHVTFRLHMSGWVLEVLILKNYNIDIHHGQSTE